MSSTPNKAKDGGFTLDHDSLQRLVLIDAEGRSHVDVEPVRCFPISHPDRWISLCNQEGHELACIEDLSTLPKKTRWMLEEELAGHEFVPVITRIHEVIEDADSCRWHVDTDRGSVRFRTADENSIRRLGENRGMILDTEGIRYLIPDIAGFDTKSRRILDRRL